MSDGAGDVLSALKYALVLGTTLCEGRKRYLYFTDE